MPIHVISVVCKYNKVSFYCMTISWHKIFHLHYAIISCQQTSHFWLSRQTSYVWCSWAWLMILAWFLSSLLIVCITCEPCTSSALLTFIALMFDKQSPKLWIDLEHFLCNWNSQTIFHNDFQIWELKIKLKKNL